MTPAMLKALEAIRLHLRYKTHSPSYQEIADAIGVKSKSRVSDLIRALEERGEIRRLPNRARSIEVVNKTDFDRGFAAGRLSVLSEIEAKH